MVKRGSQNQQPKESKGQILMAAEKKGLYANIHAKRKRGEKMRKAGAKGAPTAADFKRAAKTAKGRK